MRIPMAEKVLLVDDEVDFLEKLIDIKALSEKIKKAQARKIIGRCQFTMEEGRFRSAIKDPATPAAKINSTNPSR